MKKKWRKLKKRIKRFFHGRVEYVKIYLPNDTVGWVAPFPLASEYELNPIKLHKSYCISEYDMHLFGKKMIQQAKESLARDLVKLILDAPKGLFLDVYEDKFTGKTFVEFNAYVLKKELDK